MNLLHKVLHEVLHEVFEKVLYSVYYQIRDEKQNAPNYWTPFNISIKEITYNKIK